MLACEDDPRICSARRLVRLSLATEVRGWARPPRGGILLDPHAEVPLTRADGEGTGAGGLVAVDCSWNRLGDRGEFPSSVLPKVRGLTRRRLPLLLAANPQHYGRWSELNTAEALGAALALTVGLEVARSYFARLSGGAGFLELNAGPLEEYGEVSDPRDVAAIEARYFTGRE